MTKILLASALFFLSVFPNTSFALENNEHWTISEHIYFDVFEDGKMNGHKIIADVLIVVENYKPRITWSHIYITPWHNEKVVILKQERFSSTDGSIQDIRLNNDQTITFQITPGIFILDPTSTRNPQVWIKFSNDIKFKQVLDISCTMIAWSNILNRKFTKSWKQSKQSSFELPYKRVF